MTLAFGRDHLAIPGPSIIPSRVLRAMHRPAPNIYAGELVAITESILSDLNRLAGCSGQAVIYIGNGHAAWEAALVNMLAPGERLLGLCNGRFGRGWAGMASALGIDVRTLESTPAEPVDPARLEQVLHDDTGHRIRAVCTVHSDTSTSTRNDLAALRGALDAAGHPALLMVDGICSFGCEPFDMDALGVDVYVTACQKGLMTPPGLALVFVGERAVAARGNAPRSPYWDWRPRIAPRLFPERFCGTPPTHHLYGLREALDMLFEEGREAVWTRHRALAGCVWAALDAWAVHGDIRPLVAQRAHRSLAVTAVRLTDGDAERLRDWCEREAGVTLGIGMELQHVDDSGAATTRVPGSAQFRIGHMGHLNPPMLLGTLASIDTGFKALGIAHGEGAVSAAGSALAAARSVPAAAR